MTKNHSEEIRRRIQEEATRQFATRGFSGTSLETIADGVGIRRPSLLYHFGSKERLREAVLEELFQHWKDEIPRVLTAATGEQDRFDATIEAFLGFFLEDPNRARLILREALDRPEELQKFLQHHLTPWSKIITHYIRLGQRLGLVGDRVNPEAYVIQVIVQVIATTAVGYVAAAVFESEVRQSREAKVAELVRMARASLFLRPSPSKEVEDNG